LLQTKEEGKALLKAIAQKRNRQEAVEMQVCLFIINLSKASDYRLCFLLFDFVSLIVSTNFLSQDNKTHILILSFIAVFS
jgi:hypothetical protein